MSAALHQSLVLAGRTALHWRAQPAPFLVNLLFPTLVLVMMGGLLGGALAGDVPDYVDYAVPGVLAVAMLFGLESTMLAVTTDAQRTITDRFRSLPIAGIAVPAGRCIADMGASVITLAVTAIAGIALGWRPEGAGGIALSLALLLWLRFGLLWLGLWAGLRARSPEVVAAVQILVWPVSMLSSVFVDPTTMPRWLGTLAACNPLSLTTEAIRHLTGAGSLSDPLGTGLWTIVLALLAPAALVAVFAPLAVRAHRALGA